MRAAQSVEDQMKVVQEDATKRANLMDMLNFFEALGVAIRGGVVDEDTAKLFFRTIVMDYWNGAEAFIKKRRAERTNARLSCELEWLHDRWKS